MFSIVKGRSFWKRSENRLKAVKAPRRPSRKLAGSHIHDLVGLGKALLLCKKCQTKFNAAINGYEMMRETTGFDYCFGRCDDCNSFTECNTYLNFRG